jgi:hypothetical protein
MTPRQAQRHGRRGSRGSRLLLALALVGAPALTGVAWAAPPAPAGQARTTEQQRLTDECARLRSALGQAQADIASLKQGDRGVRDDYRLRRRMADAEQLARQLTAAEGDLRRLDAGARSAAVPASPAVTGPAEAPGVLQARADLLSDQARRLAQQAAGYQRTATQLRARQTLRRRAGQMERDPFGAMDGSKRFMVVRGQDGTDTLTTTGGPERASTPTNNPTAPPPAPPAGSQPGAAGLAPPPSTDNKGGSTSTTTPVVPPPPPTSARALLDPALAAELSKLEASGGAGIGDVDKLERAAAALQQRAQGLEAQAQALRARAAKH